MIVITSEIKWFRLNLSSLTLDQIKAFSYLYILYTFFHYNRKCINLENHSYLYVTVIDIIKPIHIVIEVFIISSTMHINSGKGPYINRKASINVMARFAMAY